MFGVAKQQELIPARNQSRAMRLAHKRKDLVKRTATARLFGRLLLVVGAVTLAATVLAMGASAAAPPAPYANGFETAEDVGTTDQAMFNVTQVVTGTAGSPRRAAATTPSRPSVGRKFTRYGGYSTTFPAGGYTTSADIYLDTAASTGGADLRFDWSSAISNTERCPRRDFIFNVGTDGNGGFVMSASNNAGRAMQPGQPGSTARSRSPRAAGTRSSTTSDNGGGVLAADLTVRPLGAATPLAHVDAERPVGHHRHTVGGNRYGWLVNNELPLALDNITRSGVVAPAPTCKTVATSLGSFTAAVVNPGADYAGPLPLSGCQIGVYFDQDGSVKNADIAGATHYGVFADKGAKVDVTGSKIHQIGNSPFNGAQNGRAVFYANGATGTVSGNTIYDYQKNGVRRDRRHDRRAGAEQHGHRPRAPHTIAQNGVVILDEATALIKGNSISGNWYTPTSYTAYGLLLIDAKGVKQQANSFLDNEANLGNFGRGGGNTNA